MRGVLLALERRAVDLAVLADLGADSLDRAVAQRAGSFGHLAELLHEVRLRRGHGFGCNGHWRMS